MLQYQSVNQILHHKPGTLVDSKTHFIASTKNMNYKHNDNSRNSSRIANFTLILYLYTAQAPTPAMTRPKKITHKKLQPTSVEGLLPGQNSVIVDFMQQQWWKLSSLVSLLLVLEELQLIMNFSTEFRIWEYALMHVSCSFMYNNESAPQLHSQLPQVFLHLQPEH